MNWFSFRAAQNVEDQEFDDCEPDWRELSCTVHTARKHHEDGYIRPGDRYKRTVAMCEGKFVVYKTRILE
jgi:hypothetical protein